MRQIVLDTETTGLSAEDGDRIIEIGCVELVNRRRTGRFRHFYLNPDRDSAPEALRVHGLTREFLRDKPQFGQIADDLLDFLAGAEIIIHNAGFDVGFIDRELELAGRPRLIEHVDRITDTVALAREMFPGKRNSLDALCDRLGVDRSGRTLHGALLDAELLTEVYLQLTRGQDALLIDLAVSAVDAAGAGTQPVDLSAFDLPVLPASEAERAEHARVLAELDKASGGRTLWRQAEPGAVA